jgi:ABC-type branched-subunit amino acid transport system substrate-binding protein
MTMRTSDSPAHTKLRLSGAAVGCLALALAATACGTSSGSASSAVNVGVIAGYTGSYVSFSDELLNGAQVAAYDINKAGGVLGHPMHLIPVNDGLDPVDTVPAVQKMLALDNVKLEAGLAALDYSAGLPILNKARMVSVSYIGPDYGNIVMPYHWNIDPSDSELGLAMAYYAKEKGYNRIAVVFDTSQGAQSIVPSIVTAARALGLTIVAKPFVPENAPAYQTAITQVINAKPDAVLMQVEPAQAGTFFQQWQSLGAGALPLIGTDATLDQEFLHAVGATVAGHLTSIEGINRTSSPYYNTFVSSWGKITKHPFSYVGGFLYDGTIMAALAMTEAKSTDPTVYYKYIPDVTQPGPGKITVYSYAQGVKLIKEGKQIKYSGVTGPLVFNVYHRPTGDYAAYTEQLGKNPVQIAVIPAEKLVGL